MVREWDPRTASSAEIAQLLETFNAAWAADLPDDPPWQDGELRGYLAEVMPGSRRICWIAQGEPADGSPALLGYGNVLLLGDIGVIEVLVHPAARRLGLAGICSSVAARRTYQEGFRWLGAEVVGGTPATGFYESLGFNGSSWRSAGCCASPPWTGPALREARRRRPGVRGAVPPGRARRRS